MFLKAGLLSLILLFASRLFGLLRESSVAAAFGSTGLADVAVLMLTFPDWLASVLAGGSLAYVLLPHWAKQDAAGIAGSQRLATRWILLAGMLLAPVLIHFREPAVVLLVAGLNPSLLPYGARAMVWCSLAFPAALLASLWNTRLQHERDFVGLYSANLVVTGGIVMTLWTVAELQGHGQNSQPYAVITVLGTGLLAAMTMRLLWVRWRIYLLLRGGTQSPLLAAPNGAELMPRSSLWLWASLASGLPLALPFAARSMASQGGEGALATFNYASKLVELPLSLAIQLVATLSFPTITKAFTADGRGLARGGKQSDANTIAAVRHSLALAWTLACASVAGLMVAAPAATQLLFGWGRMSPEALSRVAALCSIGAWGLLPQAITAVILIIFAIQGRMGLAAGAYALAFIALLISGGSSKGNGELLMHWMNFAHAIVAAISVAALGTQAVRWLPWRCLTVTFFMLSSVALISSSGVMRIEGLGAASGIILGMAVAILLVVLALMTCPDLRRAIER